MNTTRLSLTIWTISPKAEANRDTLKWLYSILKDLTFSLLGVHIQSEAHTARGRCDTLVQTDDYVYAFEFKLGKSAAEALAQIKERGYLAPFADSPKAKIAMGISFSTQERRVAEWDVEEH